MAASAYIHIPFCAHKCDFCDFTAFAGLDHLSGQYCRIVCREIEDRVKDRPAGSAALPPLASVFYGGGTPGLIDPADLALIHETIVGRIGLADDAEITLETTPQAITEGKCQAWLALGINRLSIGVESFQDQELLAIGRGQNSRDAVAGIEIARRSGFTNLSLDFMYGLPSQTAASWRQTLETALSFKLPHLSAYGLTIAGNSPLLSRYPRDSSAYPQEETFVEMYQILVSMAESAQLKQYEISNFAYPGFEGRHNWSYWTNDEYLAFGVGAHRYINGIRSANFRSLSRYMNDWLAVETSEEIDGGKRIQEAVFLALRTRKGINLLEFRQKYGLSLEEKYARQIDSLQEGGFISFENEHLVLSQKGILVSNLVMAEFM